MFLRIDIESPTIVKKLRLTKEKEREIQLVVTML